MQKQKKNKGITLVALVVTIIILLILAVVSVNAVVGENGIIARTIESKIVTTIADIVFNIEDNIVDINIGDLSNKVEKSSTEMMSELINRKVIKDPEDPDYIYNIYSQLLQSEIIDNRLNGLYLSYNGDIWLDNYKRGKIKLSKNTNTIYSKDTKTKITVIDGTIEETKDNKQYYLHALKNRNDFAYWVNQYGQIVSIYPDTRIFITNSREDEYTAVYDRKWKQGNMVANGFIIGLESNIIKKDGRYYLEAQATYNPHSVFTSPKIWDMTDEELIEDGVSPNAAFMYIGEKINIMGVYTSENIELLIDAQNNLEELDRSNI